MRYFSKKRFTMRQVAGLLTIVFLGVSVITYAVTIPNSFSGGNPILAGEMNANFTALKTAVDALEARVNGLRLASTGLSHASGYEPLFLLYGHELKRYI